jgi:outer membrane immunogenic protein
LIDEESYMKKILLASTALAMLAGIGAASAADLPTRKGPPVAPIYVPPAFTWTGFYVGLNAGYIWQNSNKNNTLPLGATAVGGFIPSSGGNNGGFIGGGQVGYNYQFTPGQGFVLGAEADIQYADVGKKSNNLGSYTFASTPGTVFTPTTSSGGSSGNYFGTVRARVGYAFDRFLIYATGGLAYGDVGRRNNGGAVTAFTAPGAVNPFSGTIAPAGGTTTFLGATSNSSTRAGWTIGGGLEYAVWQNWTVKAEYLYYNLGNGKNNNIVSPFFTGTTSKRNQDGNIVRVGVNYKFW